MTSTTLKYIRHTMTAVTRDFMTPAENLVAWMRKVKPLQRKLHTDRAFGLDENQNIKLRLTLNSADAAS